MASARVRQAGQVARLCEFLMPRFNRIEVLEPQLCWHLGPRPQVLQYEKLTNYGHSLRSLIGRAQGRVPNSAEFPRRSGDTAPRP